MDEKRKNDTDNLIINSRESDTSILRLKEYEKQCSISKYNLTLNNVKYTNSTRIGNYIYYAPCIGKGSFSKVFIGHHISDRDMDNGITKFVAIKRINTSSIKKMSLRRLNSEISLLKNLDHKNIVKFYEAFTDISNNIYIVTEYCNSGSLELYTKEVYLDHSTIKKYMTGIKEGLKYLISNNVLHRDLKPQNILLHKEGEEISIKIADFGFAKQYDMLDEDSITSTLCGTPMYLAPELVKNKKYTLVSDLWSIGVIFYQLFHHSTPFKKPKNILELISNIDTMKIKFLVNIDKSAIELMEGLLYIDPYRRMDWDNFISHNYFEISDLSQGGSNNNSSSASNSRKNSGCSNNENLNISLSIPKNLQYEGLSSDEEDEQDHRGISIENKVEKSFIQQKSKLYSEPNIVNDYIEFIPSSAPTEKPVFKQSKDSATSSITSSWTDSPVLKYITSSLTKITETLNLGGK